MRPEQKSQLLLGVTRAKSKMLEYSVPRDYHIKITQDPAKLFTISIAGRPCRCYQPERARSRFPLGDENQSAVFRSLFRLLSPVKAERNT